MEENKVNKQDHSIDDIYKIVSNIEQYIKEFKLSAAQIDLKTDVIKDDIVDLKYGSLNNFLSQLIIYIDEIKDRVTNDFEYFENSNQRSFTDFSDTTKKNIEKVAKDTTVELNDTLSDISKTLKLINSNVNTIINILNKNNLNK